MITKESVINQLAHMRVSELYETNPWFRDFIDCGHVESDWGEFDRNSDYPYISNGSSRGVLIYDDFDWVIKFNFNDEVKEKYDFCENEVGIYYEAESEGLEEYFAKIWCAGDIKGVPFYVMEKAVMNSSYSVCCRTDSNVCNTNETYSDFLDNNRSWMSKEDLVTIINFFGTTYSEDEVFELINFCEENSIVDIHDSNVGYINSRPVIIDYASW